MNWLWLLLALLVLALLAWWLFDNDDGDVVEYTDNAAVEQPVPMAAPMAVPAGMAVGDTVNVENVRVTSLAGDMAFNADVNGQTMLVLFDQQRTPNDATEGEYDINPGSIVNLTGSVRSANDALPQGVTAQVPAGTDRYIYAESIEMVN